MLSTCATSYQAPYVLYDFAVHPEAKGSYLYESTPLGRGGNGSTYKALLPSMTLKQTYVTPDYILGAVTIDRTQEYMKIHSQNKWMGVIFEGGLALSLIHIFSNYSWRERTWEFLKSSKPEA